MLAFKTFPLGKTCHPELSPLLYFLSSIPCHGIRSEQAMTLQTDYSGDQDGLEKPGQGDTV